MTEKYFRIFETHDKVWIMAEIALSDPDFPEYLKMMQMNGAGNYIITQRTGVQDILGVFIYEGDIVSYSDQRYLVIYDNLGFALESLTDKFVLEIPITECEVIGNALDNPEMLL